MNNHPKVDAFDWCRENGISKGDILESGHWVLPRKVCTIWKGHVELRNVRDNGTVFQPMWPKSLPADVRKRP